MNRLPPKYLEGFSAGIGNPHPRREAAGEPAGRESAPPLPFEEQAKRRLHPLEAFPRLLANAQANRPPGEEDQFRFWWFGLFYQGPAQDSFTLRLRLPGGRLRGFQLAGLAEITQELAGGCVVLNPQGGLDVPGVPVRASAEILRRTEGTGLSARLTGGDTVQAVRGGGREGLADGSAPPVIYPLVCELEQVLAHRRDLADLPGGCAVAIRAEDEATADAPGDTLVFQAEGAGFRLRLPGGGDAGLGLAAGQVVPACLALLEAWAARGDRTDRARAGLADFCAGLGSEALAALLGRAARPVAAAASQQADPLESLQTPGLEVPGGRLLSGQLAALGWLAEEVRVVAPGRVWVPRSADERALREALGL